MIKDKTILLVGGKALSPDLQKALRLEKGVQIREAKSFDAFCNRISSQKTDLILTILGLEDGSAFDILTFLHDSDIRIPLLVLTSQNQPPLDPHFSENIVVINDKVEVQDVIQFIHQKIAKNENENYSLNEFVQLAKLACETTQILVCTDKGNCPENNCDAWDRNKTFGKITLVDGEITSSTRGEFEGVEALKRLLSTRDARVCIESNDQLTSNTLDNDWAKKFFAVVDEDVFENQHQPTPLHGVQAVPGRMVQASSSSNSVRSTIGHGTSGVPFLVQADFAKENIPAPPTKPTKLDTDEILDVFEDSIGTDEFLFSSKTSVSVDPLGKEKTNPEIKVKPALIEEKEEELEEIVGEIGQLLDDAMEAILSRDYNLAFRILTAVLKQDPTHRTAQANLTRIQQLLKDGK